MYLNATRCGCAVKWLMAFPRWWRCSAATRLSGCQRDHVTAGATHHRRHPNVPMSAAAAGSIVPRTIISPCLVLQAAQQLQAVRGSKTLRPALRSFVHRAVAAHERLRPPGVLVEHPHGGLHEAHHGSTHRRYSRSSSARTCPSRSTRTLGGTRPDGQPRGARPATPHPRVSPAATTRQTQASASCPASTRTQSEVDRSRDHWRL